MKSLPTSSTLPTLERETEILPTTIAIAMSGSFEMERSFCPPYAFPLSYLTTITSGTTFREDSPLVALVPSFRCSNVRRRSFPPPVATTMSGSFETEGSFCAPYVFCVFSSVLSNDDYYRRRLSATLVLPTIATNDHYHPATRTEW